MSVVLGTGEAQELALRLGQLEDWLLHAEDHVLDALAAFAFHSEARPRLAVGFLVEDLGAHAVTLHRQLRALPATAARPAAGADDE